MRELAASLLAAIALVLAGCSPEANPGTWSWARHVRHTDGSEFVLDGDSDRPFVLVFSAEWAGPCQPLLAEVGRLRDRARVVAVELDSPSQRADSARNPQLEWTSAISDTLAVLMNIDALPTTIVLDRSGRELLRVEGSGGSVLAEVEQAIMAADGPEGEP